MQAAHMGMRRRIPAHSASLAPPLDAHEAQADGPRCGSGVVVVSLHVVADGLARRSAAPKRYVIVRPVR